MIKQILKNNPSISQTEMQIDGNIIYKQTYENGQDDYQIFIDEQVNPMTGQLQKCAPHFKIVPKWKLDLNPDGSERVSDISDVLDVDMNYPSIQQQIARLDVPASELDDDDFDGYEDHDDDGDEPISKFEDRAVNAVKAMSAYKTKLRDKKLEKDREALKDELRQELLSEGVNREKDA